MSLAVLARIRLCRDFGSERDSRFKVPMCEMDLFVHQMGKYIIEKIISQTPLQ